jgi:hypothetical protein
LGFTKETTKKVIPKSNITSFKTDLKVEALGANFFSKFKSENLRCILFFHHKTNKKKTIITGMIISREK